MKARVAKASDSPIKSSSPHSVLLDPQSEGVVRISGQYGFNFLSVSIHSATTPTASRASVSQRHERF